MAIEAVNSLLPRELQGVINLSRVAQALPGGVEAPPASGMNCLGWLSRDSGHNLVPVPPQIMTGVIRLDVI